MFDAPTGLVAGLLLAVLPVTSHAAQDARPYAMATLAALVAMLMLYRALDHTGADRWGGYALALLCTGMLHLVAAAVVLPFAVLVRLKGRDRFGAWAAVTAVCVFPMLAFILLGRGQTGQGSVTANGIARLPEQLVGSSHGAIALAVLVLLGVCFAGRAGVSLLIWAVVPPAGLFLLRNVTHLFDPSYFVFTVPAWTLLAAAGLCGLIRELPGRASGLATRQLAFGVLATAALVGLLLPDLRAVRAPLTSGQPDFQSAAQWLTAQQRSGDGITYTGVLGTPQLSMDYDLRDDAGAPKNAFLSQTPEQAGTYTGVACLAPALCAQGLTRIWLLSTAPTASLYTGMSAPQASLLKLNYKQVSVRTFPGGITLVLLGQIPVKG
jgi:mannosyltransferase